MKIVTFGLGGYDPSKPNDNIVSIEEIDEPQSPLNVSGVIATLNAVLGIWTLEQAAAAVHLAPDDLVREAQAWALGATDGN